jgi:hypothetical protein
MAKKYDKEDFFLNLPLFDDETILQLLRCAMLFWDED